LRLRSTQRILRDRWWGEEGVVFDTYSGETHYLNVLASAIFRRVSAAGSVELEMLCTELARPGDSAGAPEVTAESIGSAAGRLHRIGLIRADDSDT
jgi:PqqD family protein of HPr-rel-A system